MQKRKAYRIAILGILMAIIFVQSLVPFLGFIPTGFINITIIHITVIVAAIVLGPKDGAIVGLVWGLGTMVRAFTSPTSIIDTTVFTNPIVAVLPRVIVGLVAGYIYLALKNRFKKRMVSMGIAAAVGSLTNTLLVLGLMRVMYASALSQAYTTQTDLLNKLLLIIIGTNGIPEMIAAIIIAPAISAAILKANKFLD
ncbi:ECF transporter S component [Companilactobacillus nodensis]|uniref:Integral membrane protein n=1 Tax=Companilactobacillus nodensis DSM 19682 = JCM 14932 = NBRC 107160 TaxID=1423775 RepID=A0A0R1KBS3_9LACO|nr:ECF transporter S component [Companilactobacillus nodensis]KRK81013.1 integral membrane protein [Companilactobacillus nodensis DSM 19682 = JCM 14932 = NBRC 107160]